MGGEGGAGAEAAVRGKVSMKKLFARKKIKKDGTEGKVRRAGELVCVLGRMRQARRLAAWRASVVAVSLCCQGARRAGGG